MILALVYGNQLTVMALNPRKHIRTEAVIHSAKKYVLQRSLNLAVKLKQLQAY